MNQKGRMMDFVECGHASDIVWTKSAAGITKRLFEKESGMEGRGVITGLFAKIEGGE